MLVKKLGWDGKKRKIWEKHSVDNAFGRFGFCPVQYNQEN